MLTCFLKSENEKDIDCEIVQYADRLWVNREGGLDCLRSFMVHNLDKNKSISRIRMVIPRESLNKVEDISKKFLDTNYIFVRSSFITGGYRRIKDDPIAECGRIDYDSFKDVNIYYNNIITTRPLKPHSAVLVEIKNEANPIKPGEFRLIATSFTTNPILKPMFGGGDIFHLEVNYFDKRDIQQAIEDLIGAEKLEIPVRKIYNDETKQGGFDIFIYLPPELQGQNFNCERMTTTPHQFDGTEGKDRQKFIWRGRYIFPKEDYLMMNKTSFSLEGYIHNPAKFEEMRQNITRIFTSIRKDKKWVYASIALAVLSLLGTFWNSICTSICWACNTISGFIKLK